MPEVDAARGTRRGLIFHGGAVAGVIGGVVFSLVMALVNARQGQSVWRAFKIAAYPFMGERVMSRGFDAAAVALGLVDHFAVSIIWGILFAAVALGLSRWATVGFGAIWGLLVLFGMMYFVVPLAGAIRVEDRMAIGAAVLEHAAFGLALGVGFLQFQRPEPRRTDRWLPRPA